MTGWNCLKLLMWPWCPPGPSLCVLSYTHISCSCDLSCSHTYLLIYTPTCTFILTHAHTIHTHSCTHTHMLVHKCLLMYTLICLYLHPHTCTFTHSMQQVGLLTCCLYSCPHTFVCLLTCLPSSPMHTPSYNHSGVWGACVRDRHSQLGVDLT